MNEQIWWYLSRGSGIVALVLLVLSTVWGVLLATRVLEPLDRPAWLLDMHGRLGGLAVVMTALHLVGLVLDGYVHFGWAELFVPGASPYRPVAVGIGVVSVYVLVAIELTSLLRRRLPRRVWKWTHLMSYLVVWGGLLHAGMSGTDVSNRVYQATALVLTVLATTAAVLRITMGSRGRRVRPSRAHPEPSGGIEPAAT